MREKRVNIFCTIVAILVMLFLIAPLVVIVIASFTPTAVVVFPPKGFSLQWFQKAFASPSFISGFQTSFAVSLAGTLLAMLLGAVLMLAYMNEESLRKTLETGYTWFWSRSRQELWNKGATSGHLQKVVEIYGDCDDDTLLVKVIQTGAACHTGNRTCFFNRIK